MDYYWQLPDGRIWGFSEVAWVEESALLSQNLSQVPDEEALRDRIRFYGGDLGPLATLEDRRPGDDYDLIDGRWVKVRFSKKDFLLWCGLEQVVKLNATRQSNPTTETVYTLLMAAEFIDVTDPATVRMVQLLAMEAAGEVLTAEDVTRILAGEDYADTDSAGN